MMRSRVLAFMACLSLVLPIALLTAEEPPKVGEEHVCPVCRVHEGGKPEKVVTTATYKGVTYGFCNEKCKEIFLEDPEGYLPPVFPRPLPAFTVKTFQGEEVGSQSLTGKPILLDFWAPGSKRTVGAMPELQKLHDRYSPQGFSVVGISVQEGPGADEKARESVEQQKIGYPIYLGMTQSPAEKALSLKTIPAMYLIDAKGQIVQQWSGIVDLKEVEQAVEKLVSSKG